MFLVNQAMVNVSIGTAAIIVVLGMGVVFLGLALLMWVTQLMGKIMSSRKKKAACAPDVQPVPAKPAPGSAGQVKLYDVSDRTAATLMAIVANRTGKPLNELRFISIREIKQ